MPEDKELISDFKKSLELDAVFPVTEGGWFFPSGQGDQGRYQPPNSAPPLGEGGIDPLIRSTRPWSSGYYLLTTGFNSLGALHTLKCDEHYTLVDGDPAELFTITPGGQSSKKVLSQNGARHFVVPGNVVHAVKTLGGCGYSLFYLTTVPAYEPADAHIDSRASLLSKFPDLAEEIELYTHDKDLTPFTGGSREPYLESSNRDVVKIEPLLTVGESVFGYRLAGVPDGLGAYQDPDNEDFIRVLITHELQFIEGSVRKHGAHGAFVSEWRLDTTEWKNNKVLTIDSGEDLIQELHYWSSSRQMFREGKFFPMERLCSADLPPDSATYFEDEKTGEEFGTKEKLFLGGEETHTKYRPDHGRAIAHIVSGALRGHSWELPHLGRCSYENVPLCHYQQRKTIAIGLDDATNFTEQSYSRRDVCSELFVYVGTKQKSENPVEAAGLFGGKLYGVQVVEDRTMLKVIGAENRGTGFGGESVRDFTLVQMSDPTRNDPFDEPGVAQQKECIRLNVTRFLRIEDGAWDPRPGFQDQFYFVTTDEYDGNSRLFRLTFDDIKDPEAGGRIEILLNGLDNGVRRFQMLDSLCVDDWGRVLLQEDSGSKPERSKTMVYDPATEDLRLATITSEKLFGGGPGQLTQDEETSGIISVFDLLGEGWYLTNVQAHSKGKFAAPLFDGLDPDQAARLRRSLVEDGQLLAVYIPKDISALPKV